MNNAEALYIRPGEAIPADFHFDRRVEIEPIQMADILDMAFDDLFEVTTMEDQFRRFRRYEAPADITVRLKGGRKFRILRTELHLALEVGGVFHVLVPNPLYDQPITLEQFEALLEEDEIAAAYEYRDYD